MTELKKPAMGAADAAKAAMASLKKEESPVQTIRKGGYQGVRLMQIIRADGSKFKPDEFGVYYPQSDEEKKLCEYYVKVGRLQAAAE